MTALSIRARDGVELSAVFHPSARTRSPRQVAVIHGGAGIAAARYRHFAEFLAESGIPVLTYDYRGIGSSRPARLRGYAATTADWVEFDAAAAIEWIGDRFPDEERIGISHSIGALALAGAPNAGRQDRLVFIAPHTAYYGDYQAAYRLPMALFWHGFMPTLTRLVGYFPASRLGLGEDLPAQIALEWSARRSPGLRPLPGDPRASRLAPLFDRAEKLERPALALMMSDDAFATARGASRLLAHFPRLAARTVVLTPLEANVPRLGHFGFFTREPGVSLWPRLLALLARPEP